MPLFEVSVTRHVTERAEVEVEAATKEEAQSLIEDDLEQLSTEWDYDWYLADCNDDGSVFLVVEKQPDVA